MQCMPIGRAAAFKAVVEGSNPFAAFEICVTSFLTDITQWLECLFYTQRVGGSNPSIGTLRASY